MRLQSILASAAAFFAATATCAAYVKPQSGLEARDERVPEGMEPSDDIWEMHESSASDSRYPTWVATRHVGEIREIKDLYLEASKAFHWVKGRQNALTSTGTVLVAAFYDAGKQTVYASTIPRGNYLGFMRRTENHDAPVWKAHYDKVHEGEDLQNSRIDAEDGAYFLREVEAPNNIGSGEDPLDFKYGQGDSKGSKIAVWGVKNSDPHKVRSEPGKPIAQCEQCNRLAKELAVYTKAPE